MCELRLGGKHAWRACDPNTGRVRIHLVAAWFERSYALVGAFLFCPIRSQQFSVSPVLCGIGNNQPHIRDQEVKLPLVANFQPTTTWLTGVLPYPPFWPKSESTLVVFLTIRTNVFFGLNTSPAESTYNKGFSDKVSGIFWLSIQRSVHFIFPKKQYTAGFCVPHRSHIASTSGSTYWDTSNGSYPSC